MGRIYGVFIEWIGISYLPECSTNVGMVKRETMKKKRLGLRKIHYRVLLIKTETSDGSRQSHLRNS